MNTFKKIIIYIVAIILCELFIFADFHYLVPLVYTTDIYTQSYEYFCYIIGIILGISIVKYFNK